MFLNRFNGKCQVTLFVAGLLTLLVVSATLGAVPSGEMVNRSFNTADIEAFLRSPASFRPETWFHFIGGNVSSQGVTADLEAIASAGISGIQLFHGQFGGPWPGVEPQIKCLSESWDEAVGHVAAECRRLGLRFTMQNCPGWAMAGGPWVSTDKAMRHLVWSRMDLTGGAMREVQLPLPQPSGEDWRDYREVAVIAFPTPADDTGRPLMPVAARSNQPSLPWQQLFDPNQPAILRVEPAAAPAWVELDFAQPITLRSLELPPVERFTLRRNFDPGATIVVQAVTNEGLKEVARCVVPRSNWQDNRPLTLACSDATAPRYRITFVMKYPLEFDSIKLFTAARHHNWESQAAFVLRSLDRVPHPDQDCTTWVNSARIVNLTGAMDDQGTLRWDAPPGQWTVLRWGHVNTGKRNGPAPAEATGWECDKLSALGAETHFAGYIGRLTAAAGPLRGDSLKGILLDSWECETQTWTSGMGDTFEQLRGYPLTAWFPALAGYVVDDPETTVRFLRDWRATVNDLLVENFFGRMAELAHERGLTVSFETASGDVFPGDILEYYKHADVPMCEFWQPDDPHRGKLETKPVAPCVSAARLYGKPRVAAEAFTSIDLHWDEHPAMLKDYANRHFADGVTHLVFHTYTHNPRTDFLAPGSSFGAGIGTPFLRGQTWWRHMPEFSGYLARCGYLLERGRPVSDVLWYLGDELDHKPRQDTPFPAGYRFDYCNPDILLNRLSVRDGRIVTPEGLSYRVLWLRDCPRLLPDTVEKLLALATAGATVIGNPPQGVATLSGGTPAEQRFTDAVRALWGKPPVPGERRVGQGRVLSGLSLDAALHQLGIEPDVKGTGVVWCHRQTSDADWYFVAAPANQGFQGPLAFRATGTVELWDPVSGSITPAKSVHRQNTSTQVTLDIAPSGSLFVVFHHGKDHTPPLNAETRIPLRQTALAGPWTLSFPSGWGAPDTIRLDVLQSWPELDLSAEGRAFSGTAVYTTEFTMESMETNARAELDLGRVEVIATVRVNGEPVGTAWSPPYRLDITHGLKPGLNRLTVEVTNTWFNRLVYDAGLPEANRKTWTIAGPAKDLPPRLAGLLGPVTLHLSRIVTE